MKRTLDNYIPHLSQNTGGGGSVVVFFVFILGGYIEVICPSVSVSKCAKYGDLPFPNKSTCVEHFAIKIFARLPDGLKHAQRVKKVCFLPVWRESTR